MVIKCHISSYFYLLYCITYISFIEHIFDLYEVSKYLQHMVCTNNLKQKAYRSQSESLES